MAVRHQLLLLVERGSLIESFERLADYCVSLPGSAKPYALEAEHDFADKLFRETLVKAETDYSAELGRAVKQSKPGGLRLPGANTSVSVSVAETHSLRLELWVEPYEAYLFFPKLYSDFSVVQLNVRGAGQLHGEEDDTSRVLTKIVLEIVNCFRPFYGFDAQETTVNPRVGWLSDLSERRWRELHKGFRKEPWRFFGMTAIYGEALPQRVGRSRLLAAPAVQKLELSEIVALWGPRGLLNVGNITPAYLEANHDLQSWYVGDYCSTLANYLEVQLESSGI